MAEHAVAVIGSRDLTKIQAGVKLLKVAVPWLVRHGYAVHTGGAQGVDQLAIRLTKEEGGRVKLFLPWRGYEEAGWRSLLGSEDEVIVYDTHHKAWADSVRQYHPKGYSLKPGAFKLHARNYGIVEEVKAVLALPPAPYQGGTAQGMRVADGLGIALVDLSTHVGRDALQEKMRLYRISPVG